MIEDIDILKEVSSIDFNKNRYQFINKNIMLTNREIEILNKYKIDYNNCNNLGEILFLIEDLISDMDIVDEELDFISQSISERDYYQNTNK